MRCTIPEISWHNRDPVLSIDIQPLLHNEDFYRLASGGTDSHVIVWHIRTNDEGNVSIEAAADLVRHQKAVNAVRFSPCGKFLASADDESVIMIWKQRQDSDAPELSGPGESEVVSKESWIVFKVLRGHLEDVYDVCWSPDSSSIISGSVDNTAILWDIAKGTKVILSDHKGFVQGVAWDPKGQYIASLCSDRKMRVFISSSKKLVARVGKAPLPVPKGHELEGKNMNLFHDDTIQTFFRRLCFSPDGEMIIAPSGVIEPTEPGKKPSSTTLVFSRRLLSKPVCYLPSLDEYSVCVRCCPILFELRNIDPSTKPESMFLLPYRIVFAVATACAVVLYDTQQPMPFGYISNLHYTRLTDLAWSPKGDMLMVSSTDGYCSIIAFSPGELGVEYNPNPSVSLQTVSEETKGYSEASGEVPSAVKEASGEVQPSVTSCDKELLDSSEGVACIQLSQDSVKEISRDGSDLGLGKLPREEEENVSNIRETCEPVFEEEPSDKIVLANDCGSASSEKTLLCVSQPTTSDVNVAKSIIPPSKVDSSGNLHTKPSEEVPVKCGIQSCNDLSKSHCELQAQEIKNSKNILPEDESFKKFDAGLSKDGLSFVGSSDDRSVDQQVIEEENDTQMSSQLKPADKVVTPSNSGKKARRVQLITLSSPKSRKKLL